MSPLTEAAIKEVSMRAAERVNNLYATSYMEVHSAAGPWGTKHDYDVAAVIEEEVSKVFMVMMLNKTNTSNPATNR